MKKLLQFIKDNIAYISLYISFIVAFVLIELLGGVSKSIQLDLLHFKDVARLILHSMYYGSIIFAVIILFVRKYFTIPLVFLFLYSILAYVNWLYFKFFDSYMPLTMYTQFQQLNGLSGSIVALMSFRDLLYLAIPIIVLLIHRLLKPLIISVRLFSRLIIIGAIILTTSIPMVAMRQYVIKRSQVPSLKNAIYRVIEAQPSAAYRFYGLIPILQYQIERYSATKKIILTDEYNAIIDSLIESNINSYYEVMQLFDAIPARKNLVIILMESFNTSCIRPDVMPFVDSLSRCATTLYCPNVNQMTQGAGSIGGQFVVLTGLSGLKNSVFCIDYPENRYPSVAYELKNKFSNLQSYTVVCTPKNFWRQDIVNKALGIDSLYGSESFAQREWINDSLVFDYAISKIPINGTPFLSIVVPGDMHFPYDNNELIDVSLTIDRTNMSDELYEYYRRARYVDNQIAKYISYLVDKKLYEESLIVITSDHQVPFDKLNTSNLSPYFPALFINTGINCEEKNKENINIVYGHNQVYPTILQLLNINPSSWAGVMPSMLDADFATRNSLDNLDYVTADQNIIRLYDIQDKMIRGAYWGEGSY